MNLLFASLSDMHLGEEDSLLTNLALGRAEPRPGSPSPCLSALVNYLHAVKRWLNEGKPIPFLVLNGDILELALADYPTAIPTFRVFLSEISRRRICDRIVFIPGNHDHALWSLIRDSRFLGSLQQEEERDRKSPEVKHVTEISTPAESSLLDTISSNLSLKAEPVPLFVANPAFRLQSWQKQEFLFHHGHLMEHTYTMLSLLRDRIMSDLPFEELKKKPLRDDLKHLEADNWPWIDFIWSGFARAGRVGQTVEALYELMSRPEGVKKLVDRLSSLLRTELNLPGIPEAFEDDVLRFMFQKALEWGGAGSRERAEPQRSPFNEDIQAMLSRFVTHYLQAELALEGLRPAENRTCFVFGHTHKPFLDTLREESFGRLSVVNSGGWIVESEEYRPIYGPGLVLGTNSGDLAMVHYRLDTEPGSEVRESGSWDATLKKLQEHEDLERAVAEAVRVRRGYIKQRNEKTAKLLKNLEK
jgi:predicted phosphodiesterase